MVPNFENYCEAVHAWHEAVCAYPKEYNGVPHAAVMCMVWVHEHLMLPPVCYIDTSSRAAH